MSPVVTYGNVVTTRQQKTHSSSRWFWHCLKRRPRQPVDFRRYATLRCRCLRAIQRKGIGGILQYVFAAAVIGLLGAFLVGVTAAIRGTPLARSGRFILVLLLLVPIPFLGSPPASSQANTIGFGGLPMPSPLLDVLPQSYACVGREAAGHPGVSSRRLGTNWATCSIPAVFITNRI